MKFTLRSFDTATKMITLNHWFRCFLFLVPLFVNAPLQAQQSMSLADCIQYAIENSHKTKQAQYDIENNELIIAEKKSAAKPQIDADLRYQYAFSLPEQFQTGVFSGMDARTIATRIGQDHSVFTGVMVEQNLFSPALLAGLDIVDTSRDLQQLLLKRAKEEIIYDVAEQYYGVLKNKALQKAITVNENRLNGLIDILTLQEENDIIKKTDVEGVRIKLTELESKALQLQTGIATQKLALKLLMGMPLDQEIILEDITIEMPSTIDTLQPNFDNLVVSQLLDKKAALEQQQLEVLRLENLPRISAFGYLGLQFQDDAFAVTENQPWNTNAFVGISVETPIFDGGVRKAKMQQKEVQLKKISSNRASAKELATFEHQRNVFELKNQEKQLELQERTIELQSDLYDQVLLQYKEETSSLFELLNAKAELEQSQVVYTSMLFELQQKALQLLRSQGKLGLLAEKEE